MELLKAKLAAETASVKLAVAARNLQVHRAAEQGMTIREIEHATGIPRSTVHRITNAKPLSEAEYLELANNEVLARAEVAAIQSVEETLTEAQSTTDNG